jgi:threonine/homoserine/homoserine lactone efflux protein
MSTFALIIFLFPLAYSPGPGNMFFAANAARFGLRATLPANLGYHMATFALTLATGLGFATATTTLPGLFTVLRYAGALYVLYLALKLMRASLVTTATPPRVAGFGDGAVLLLFNPKGWLIIALMFSQFLKPAQGGGQGADLAAVSWIATVFTLNNALAFLIWSAFGEALARRFRQQGQGRLLNLIFGGVLALVALWMLAG